MADKQRILVVDDSDDDREILRMRLESQGYIVVTAADGGEALLALDEELPDLILLDLMMPRLDGIATLKRIRERPDFIPVVILTARSDVDDVVEGLDAGADEYLLKPVDHAALVARVRAMLRLKVLHDRLKQQADDLSVQAAQLAEFNTSLTDRVETQVGELRRMSRLTQFLAPQVVEAIMASPDGERLLESHRREVAVLFCDLRGFTSFAETAEPEALLDLLRAYHEMLGKRIFEHEGTLERFAGDAVMVLFNDPVSTPDYCQQAVKLAFDIVEGAEALLETWRSRGAPLGVGIGIAAGIATLGKIGFSERFDYAAIGTVTNLASRLSGEAGVSEILVSSRVAEEASTVAVVRPLGARPLKGFARAVPIFQLSPGPA